LTFRERTLAIFAGEPVDKIVYQPRIEHWYRVNKDSGSLPQRYSEMSLLEVYDDLGCSIRSYAWFNPCLKVHDDPKVRVEKEEHDDITILRWITPIGSVETHYTYTDYSRHTHKFPIENRDDAKVIEYVLKGRTYSFDTNLYAERDAEIGDRAAPMLFIPRVNLQRLFIEYMGFEATLYALYDDKPLIDNLVKAIDECDECVIDVLCDSPIPIINYGDNIDHHFLKPDVFEEYILPAYQHRSARFSAAGKYTHAHWDGNIKNLLRYAQSTGCRGIEALTPIPQGDVTLEEVKEALGDMVLLDGIPMTCFLPHEPIEELEATTRKVIEMFRPNLILGISDEPSPICDIERVRLVTEIVKEY
jgi:hypothetical protein